MKLSILTCTGGRSEAWALCEHYMRRQTRQPDEWIVVDDCDPPLKCTMGQTVIRPEPRWEPGQNTQYRNMALGLKAVTGDALAIIEDDDWYAADYLQFVQGRLSQYHVVGVIPARYYHVLQRTWFEFPITSHASLCSTSLRREFIPDMIDVCAHGKWIDMNFWAAIKRAGHKIENYNVLGIKGMPGRPGISNAHREVNGRWNGDPGGDKLRQWIGSADYSAYASYYPDDVLSRGKPMAIKEVPYTTFLWRGQTRYKCQRDDGGGEKVCEWDGPSLKDLLHHDETTHANTEERVPALFDADDRPLPRTVSTREIDL